MDTLNDVRRLLPHVFDADRKQGTFTPLNVRKDGTVVFAAPVEDGKVPLIALKDIGWWARWTFDHRPEASGREFSVASDRVSWDQLVQVCGHHFAIVPKR
jgi:hypothetical protein